MPFPKPGEKVLGGHAVCAVGFDDAEKCLIVRNSWGTEWGQEGYFLMPYDFVTHDGCASDFWIVQSVTAAPKSWAQVVADGESEQLRADVLANVRARASEQSSGDKPSWSQYPGGAPEVALIGRWATGDPMVAKAGETVAITWEARGVDTVKIQYCVNSWGGMFSAWQTVADAAPNGAYKWTIPADAPADTRYYLRFSSAADAAVYCNSRYF